MLSGWLYIRYFESQRPLQDCCPKRRIKDGEGERGRGISRRQISGKCEGGLKVANGWNRVGQMIYSRRWRIFQTASRVGMRDKDIDHQSGWCNMRKRNGGGPGMAFGAISIIYLLFFRMCSHGFIYMRNVTLLSYFRKSFSLSREEKKW